MKTPKSLEALVRDGLVEVAAGVEHPHRAGRGGGGLRAKDQAVNARLDGWTVP